MKNKTRLIWLPLLILALGCNSSHESAPSASPGEIPNGSEGDTTHSEFTRAVDPPPQVEMELPEPNSNDPLSLGVAVLPAEVRPGETVTLVVKAKLAPTWHVYAIDRPTGVAIPTTLKLTLPEGLAPEGKWQIPEPHELKMEGLVGDEPTFVYDGEVSFQRQLKVNPDAPAGQLDLSCDVGFQLCDDSTCRPPKTVTIPTTIQVLQ